MIAGLPGCGLSALYYLALAAGMGLNRLWGVARAGLARFHKKRRPHLAHMLQQKDHTARFDHSS